MDLVVQMKLKLKLRGGRWKVEGWKPSQCHMRREQKKGSTRFPGYWSKDEYDSLS